MHFHIVNFDDELTKQLVGTFMVSRLYFSVLHKDKLGEPGIMEEQGELLLKLISHQISQQTQIN